MNSILVVDDNHFSLNIVNALLKDYGYSVIACEAADDAINMLHQNNIDTILTNIKMPGISGLDLLDNIHALDIDIPVILMTAYPEPDMDVDVIKKGAFDFIVKPVDPEYLFHSVKRAVEHNRQIKKKKHSMSIMAEKYFNSTQDWEDIFNTITDMVTIHDNNYKIIKANRAAVEKLDLPAMEFTNPRCYEYYHGTDKPPEKCLICECIKTGKPSDAEIFEPHLNKFLEIKALPRFDKNNRLKGIVHIAKDITGRKQTDDLIKQQTADIQESLFEIHRLHDLDNERLSELNLANKQLRISLIETDCADKAKNEFLTNMGHELRTPMNAIIGMTDLALNTGLATDQREYLEMVRESADSLMDLLNKIIELSKIEADKIELEKNDFSLHKTIDHIIKTRTFPEDKKELELIYHINPDVPEYLNGDETCLRQVIVNLIDNAIKFTAKGRITVMVKQRAYGNDNINLDGQTALFHVSVSDTGTGIPENNFNIIFESFTQADGSRTRKYGGAGLGLAISRKFVNIMGGDIWVESEPGKGSTFHFTAKFGIVPGPAKQ